MGGTSGYDDFRHSAVMAIIINGMVFRLSGEPQVQAQRLEKGEAEGETEMFLYRWRAQRTKSGFHTSGFQASLRAAFKGQTVFSEPFVESGGLLEVTSIFCGGTLSKIECQGRAGEEREREESSQDRLGLASLSLVMRLLF